MVMDGDCECWAPMTLVPLHPSRHQDVDTVSSSSGLLELREHGRNQPVLLRGKPSAPCFFSSSSPLLTPPPYPPRAKGSASS